MGTPNITGIKIANIFYGIISFILAVLTALVLAIPEMMPGSETIFSFTPITGVLAFISALYSGVSFRFIAEEKPRLAASVNSVLFSGTIISAVLTSSRPIVFVAIYLLAMASIGLGSLMPVIFATIVNIGSYLAISLDLVDSSLNNAEVWLASGVILSFVVLLINFMTHHQFKPKDKSAKPIKTSSGQITADILIDAIYDGVSIINPNGLIAVFNPGAQTITGWSDQEAVNLDYRSVITFVDENGTPLEDSKNPITIALKSGNAVTDHNAVLVTRSKKQIEVDVVASPINTGGKITGVILIFRDVSKQRSEERQRAEFISTASHEMRTPVAAIEGYLALALNDKVSKIDSAARGYLEKAHASTQHLGKLFQDLLTAAKSEDGRLTNNPEVVEIGQLLDELAEGASFTAEKKGLTLKYGPNRREESGGQTVRPVAYVFVDPERIREVITNLFDNAVKYTEEGGITIDMKVEENQVIISIADTGAGIPKEDIPHLFQKFYRVDNSATRQIGGTGLGLFISRKIVELYQGRIWVESDAGKGSTFFISLPRLSPERAQELMKNEVQSPQLNSVPSNTQQAQTNAKPNQQS